MSAKTMKFILANASHFKLYRPGVFLYGDVNLNMLITRYMNIAELLGMINGYINIPMRMAFTDKLEHGIPHNTLAHCIKTHGKKTTYKDRLIWQSVHLNRQEIKNWFTLCFSEELQERASFWNAFTRGSYGVLVETRLIDFISAIDITNFNLYIGKIKYRDNVATHDLVDFAFTKETPYRDEKEIRIYLLPKTGKLEWAYEDGRSRYKMNFNFTPPIFTKITLSPYIPVEIRKIFIKELFESNKFNRNQLNISKIH